jgi:16S rRNA (uracil1498-N3)-methyltransferase
VQARWPFGPVAGAAADARRGTLWSMPPRLYVDLPLAPAAALALPPAAARHLLVLRLQPGAALTLFDGRGGEWAAEVLEVGRRAVQVRVLRHAAVERELALDVTLALGMPANDRMDALLEKATELGAAALQPLQCERAVLRLEGERAERRRAHWQAVAVAACEQCGRNRVPGVAPVATLPDWLAALPAAAAAEARLLLVAPRAQPGAAAEPELPGSPAAAALAQAARAARCVRLLSGPEGGLTDAEQAAARAAGFVPVTLGARVLRADTAPLAALAALAVLAVTGPD